jgi:AcrR family transcriptional regulator
MGRPLNSDGRQTRETVLDVALDMFAEKGFHGTSLKDIASVVGVRDSALYHYFASKEELLNAVLAERIPKMDERRRLTFEEPMRDLRAALQDATRVILQLLASPHTEKVFRVLMSDGLRLHAAQRTNLLRYFQPPGIVAFFEQMIAQKKLRGGRAELLALEFIAPFHALMSLRILQPKHPLVKDPEAFTRAHVDHFLNGASSSQD